MTGRTDRSPPVLFHRSPARPTPARSGPLPVVPRFSTAAVTPREPATEDSLFHISGIIRIIGVGRWSLGRFASIPLLVKGATRPGWELEVRGMAVGTATLQAGRLDLETILRSPLVVIADPVVAASGPPATLDELTSVTAPTPPEAGSPAEPLVSVGCGGGGAALLERPAGTILALANPEPGAGLFVWASSTFLAVVADPDGDTPLATAGQLTVPSGRLVIGAPDVVAAWGPDVDTGDGSPVRARMHRGRTRLGLIVVAHLPPGQPAVRVGVGTAAVNFPVAQDDAPHLLLAG